jgi:HSP90 family molecular chaperone
LYLKPADPEIGIEDFTDQWALSRIVRKYSDFVTYPIVGKYIREETGKDGGLAQEPNPTIIIEDKILNSMKPIWSRPQAEVSESEYADFYRRRSRPSSSKPRGQSSIKRCCSFPRRPLTICSITVIRAGCACMPNE